MTSILSYLTSDLQAEETVAQNMQQSYKDGIAHCQPLVDRVVTFYSIWLSPATQTTVLEEYADIRSQELKNFGMVIGFYCSFDLTLFSFDSWIYLFALSCVPFSFGRI